MHEEKSKKHLTPSEALCYANKLSNRSPYLESIILKSSISSYHYSTSYLKGRWKEAEPIIAKDPHHSVIYAKNILKERFTIAEPNIMADKNALLNYTISLQLVDNDIKEAILKFNNPEICVRYVQYVLQSRWSDAEHIILNDDYCAYLYALSTLYRFREAENCILKNPELCVNYAQNVICGRFVEAEPNISKSNRLTHLYIYKIQKYTDSAKVFDYGNYCVSVGLFDEPMISVFHKGKYYGVDDECVKDYISRALSDMVK